MLDGIIIANIKNDLSKIIGGRINKIYQPAKDEVVLTIRANGENHKIILSANAVSPRIHFTNEKFENPSAPPMFCVLLRKHISGNIISVEQPGFDRIIEITIEAMNELKDITQNKLIIEIMGKHSNIILVNENGIVIDSIKHVNKLISSVREILPNRKYTPPANQGKTSFLEISKQKLTQGLLEQTEVVGAIFKTFSGISPNVANMVCTKANIEPNSTQKLEQGEIDKLYTTLELLKEDIQNANFSPYIVFHKNKIKTLHNIYLDFYSNQTDYTTKHFSDISSAIEYFYINREKNYRSIQKTTDLRKILQQNIVRIVKKREKFLQNLKQIENRDEQKLYGELVTANIYKIEKGTTSFVATDFSAPDTPMVTVSLDPTLTPAQNAQQYFKLYNKQKRSYIAISQQIAESEIEQTYLESVLESLQGDLTQKEIEEIRDELVDQKILKKRSKKTKSKEVKSKEVKSQPLHFVCEDGFNIFVGKNNKQNDQITTNAATTDMWLHAKNMPGSHVIIKSNGKEIPKTTIAKAAEIAAYYSKGAQSTLVAVDYTLKKHVKKPNGAKPGMVIYTHQKTAFVEPNI